MAKTQKTLKPKGLMKDPKTNTKDNTFNMAKKILLRQCQDYYTIQAILNNGLCIIQFQWLKVFPKF